MHTISSLSTHHPAHPHSYHSYLSKTVGMHDLGSLCNCLASSNTYCITIVWWATRSIRALFCMDRRDRGKESKCQENEWRKRDQVLGPGNGAEYKKKRRKNTVWRNISWIAANVKQHASHFTHPVWYAAVTPQHRWRHARARSIHGMDDWM